MPHRQWKFKRITTVDSRKSQLLKLAFCETLANLGIEFEKEYYFHPKRRWRFDYAFPKHKIAVEVEGGIWIYGRHNRGSGMKGDMEKYNTATMMGWRVLRYDSQDLTEAIEDLKILMGIGV